MEKQKLVLFLLFTVMLWSCRDHTAGFEEELQPSVGNLTVKKAKSWYETHVNRGDNVGLRLAGSGDSTLHALKPLLDWDLATLHNDSIWSVVELPWEYENGEITFGNIEAINEAANSGGEMQQLLRLVILQNNQTGEIYGFKMAIAPDLEYMQETDLSGNNSYLSRDSNLRGLVLFYSLQDEFVNGWLYSDADTGEGALRAGNASPIEIEICASWVITVLDIEVHGQNCKTVYYLPTLDIDIGSGGGGGYNGMYSDTDGGGGGSSNNNTNDSNDNTNPKKDSDKSEADAKEIFNADIKDEEWKKLQNLLEEIVKDCLGKGLYTGLVSDLKGETIKIELSGTNGQFSIQDGKRSISIGVQMDDDQLLQELFHAYQSYREPLSSYTKALLNAEIEAHYAQYLYLSRKPNYKGSSWEKRDEEDLRRKKIKDLEELIDEKGNLRQGVKEDSLNFEMLNGVIPTFRNVKGYKNYTLDYDRTGLNNFNNIRKITINC